MLDSSVPNSVCPPQVFALLRQAEQLAAARRPAQAGAAFLLAIARDPGFTARNAYGCFLAQIGRHQEALEEFSHLLATAHLRGDATLRAVASHNMAAVYRETGHMHDAALWQQRSLTAEAADPPDPDRSVATACDLTGRGNDALLRGDYELAETLFYRSLWLEIEAGCLEGQAADWGSLGLAAGFKGDVGWAVSCLRQAFRLHREVNDPHGAGCDLLNLAQIFREIGRWTTALLCLRQAVRWFESAQAEAWMQRAARDLEEVRRVLAVKRRNPLLN